MLVLAISHHLAGTTSHNPYTKWVINFKGAYSSSWETQARREPQRGPGNNRGALSQPHSVGADREETWGGCLLTIRLGVLRSVVSSLSGVRGRTLPLSPLDGPGETILELRDVTCHMGSHTVTCYLTQMNAPRLNPSQYAGTRFTYPGGMEG